MIARLASLYVRCLLVVELLLLGLSLYIHVVALSGAHRIVADYSNYLFYWIFIVSAATIALAEEKNVWKNEFKRCPRWLRATTLTLMIYGFVVSGVQVVFFSNYGPQFLSGSSLFLGSMPLCILYPLLQSGPSGASDLVKRVRASIIVLVVCLVVIVAAQFGFLPHRA